MKFLPLLLTALLPFSVTLHAQEEAGGASLAQEQTTDAAPPADMPVARAGAVMERDVTTQAQIFLDQQLFGPGKIDGTPGEFFKKALIRYQRAKGLPETGEIDSNLPLDSVFPLYTHYTMKEQDLKFVGPLPGKPAEQAKMKRLPYPRCSSSSQSDTIARQISSRGSTRV
jgi:peptidoglycan hydrolase-like protein with peptidoglycan-binding domain